MQKPIIFLVVVLVAGLVGALKTLSAQSYVSNEHEHGSLGSDGHVDREAPNWKLFNAQGREFSRKRLRGRTHVMVFHLGSGCLHCTEQLRMFSQYLESFESLGVPIIAVSTDNHPALKQSLEDLDRDLPFELVADPQLDAFGQFRAFDIFNDEPLHATFLVDAKGRIGWQNIGKHPFMDVERLLDEIRLVTSRQQEQQDQEEQIERPKVYLDKSPRIVEYQLKRLNNERLLYVERKTDDVKYVPVYNAILTRAGMSPQYREESLAALVKLKKSDPAGELLAAIATTPSDSLQGKQTIREIARMLLNLPVDELVVQTDEFVSATESESDLTRWTAFAALAVCDKVDRALEVVGEDESKTVDWLMSISLIPEEATRSGLRSIVVKFLNTESVAIQAGAIHAIKFIPTKQTESFALVAPMIENDELRATAVTTLLSIPMKSRDKFRCYSIADYLTQYAEDTPAEERTTDGFIDCMQLVDQVLAKVPPGESNALRDRLNAVSVRVVKIGTVEDEMRYDTPYFAVEAGRPVQVILDNHDLMAHNLVITKAGALKEVAESGGAAGPGKDYLPDDRDKILFTTKMIQSDQKGRLTFDAPTEPGEYPYVCTFPQHWSRMYGVMVVVEDLDAWQKNPIKPKDPLGNTRSFVKRWTVDEFAADLKGLKAGVATNELGAKIYKEATCFQCHQLESEGGSVGPELDELFARHKGDRTAVLREILEPSHRIDEKYSMHKFLTVDGDTITGIIQSETDDTIELLDNPESKELTTVLKDDIEDRVKTSTSIMPKALLDNFTKEEVLQLFSYLENAQKK